MKSFTSLKFQHQYSEWRLLQNHMAGANMAMHVHRGSPQKPTDRPHMCTEEAHRSQLTGIACAQRRPSAPCSEWQLKPKKALSAVAAPYPSVECPNYTSLSTLDTQYLPYIYGYLLMWIPKEKFIELSSQSGPCKTVVQARKGVLVFKSRENPERSFFLFHDKPILFSRCQKTTVIEACNIVYIFHSDIHICVDFIATHSIRRFYWHSGAVASGQIVTELSMKASR